MTLVQSTPANGTDAKREGTTMSRKTNKTTTTRTTAAFEPMEARTMYSATPAVVGYLPDWENTPALVANLDKTNYTGITQLNYFSVAPNADGYLPGTGTNTADASQNGKPLTDLKTLADDAHAHGVKVNIVIGGAGRDSDAIAAILGAASTTGAGTGRLNATAADHFAASVRDFCSAYGLDGADLDWEPAALSADDVANYATLIHGVNHTVGDLKLSAAVLAEPTWLAPNYDRTSYVLNAAAITDLDQVNVMDYDLGRPGDGAPIEQAETDMVNWAKVAPASKLVMGLPFYGRGTSLSDAQMPDTNPWANVSDHNTGLAGYGKLVTAAGGTVPTTGSPNLTLTAPIAGVADNQSIAYHFDGPGTIAAKTSFALDHNYAGVMVWSLGQDSFAADGSYTDMSLMPVIKATVDARTTTPSPTPAPTVARLTGTTTRDSRFANAASTGTLANTADADLTTGFASTAATGWYGLALSAPARITQIKIAPVATHGWNMTGGTFQASNDATFTTGTVTLADITAAPAAGRLTTLTVNAAGSYRFVRYVSPAGSHGEAAEVQYFGAAAAATSSSPSSSTQQKKAGSSTFADNAAAVVDLVG